MNINKNSKFYKAPTLKERLINLKYTILFWKGRNKGMIYTRSIKLDDIRYIFFPKDFHEKYSYLGSVPYNEDGAYFKAMLPLVLAMDYEARHKLCPKWFLRFLEVFGNDRSIVRVRNWTLHNLHQKLTKGMRFIDYKTKWHDYDLRISISASKHLQDLADDIEHGYYSRGRQKELVAEIMKLDPNATIIWGNIDRLQKQLDELEDSKDEGGTQLAASADPSQEQTENTIFIGNNNKLILPLQMVWEPKNDITTLELALCIPYLLRKCHVMPYEVNKTERHFRHFKITDHNNYEQQ